MTMRFTVRQWIPAGVATVARLVDSPAAVAWLMAPLLTLRPVDGVWRERFRPGANRFQVRLLGVLPVGEQVIDVSWPAAGDSPTGPRHVLLDTGGNFLTRRYLHRISVIGTAAGDGCWCIDDSDVDAGLLTPLAVVGFWCVDRVVAARWKRLLSLLPAAALRDARPGGAVVESPAPQTEDAVGAAPPCHEP